MQSPACHIFSLTAAGAELAARLKPHLPHAVHAHRPAAFTHTAQQAFRRGQACIFICATGIVVRTLAPVLTDKYHDPPVLVLDERGRFVIPLLADHQGGASALAQQLAEHLGAACVVTSANDYRRPLYVLGVGCARHCPYATLQHLLEQAQAELTPWPPLSALASIDLKADEAALCQLAATLQQPLHTFSATQLRQVEHQLSEKSAAVFAAVGCYGVAEAAALYAASQLSGRTAELVLNKRKNAAATVAVARSYLG